MGIVSNAEWLPLSQLKRENQKILVWMDNGVNMANAYRHEDLYFWNRVKAWMPLPEPPNAI